MSLIDHSIDKNTYDAEDRPVGYRLYPVGIYETTEGKPDDESKERMSDFHNVQ